MNHKGISRIILILAILSAVLSGICSCTKNTGMSERISSRQMQEFDDRAKEICNDLVLNHTYDRENISIADSIYAESQKVGSEFGKKMSLRVKFYAYVAYPEDGEKFLEAVDEYLSLSKEDEDKSYYYDALNAKLYYLLGQEKYRTAQTLVKEAIEQAEKSEDRYGLYFANYMMSSVLQNRDNYELAIDYLLKAESYADGDSTYLSIINRELSVAYGSITDYESAYDRAVKCFDFATTAVHKVWGEDQYLGAIYNLGRYDEFISRYKSSPYLKGEYEGLLPEDMVIQLEAYYNICKGDYKKAIELADQIGYEYGRLVALYDVYQKQPDYQKALQVKTQLDDIDDQSKAEIYLEDLSEMEVQLGNSQLKLQAENLKVKNLRITYLSIVSILLVVLFAVGVISFRHRHYLKELTKKNKELDLAREKAEKASSVKSAFIKTMTHELHTPLNHISGFAQVMSSEDMPLDAESAREMSKAIFDSSQHLTNMLDNIIEVADTITTLAELEEAEKSIKNS